MINTDRIVPVMDIDLLTLYKMLVDIKDGTISLLIKADTVDGVFNIDDDLSDDKGFLNEPAKKIDFDAAVTAGVIYFVPAHDFEGVFAAGSPVTMAGEDIVADGCSLYAGTLSSGTFTVGLITPDAENHA